MFEQSKESHSKQLTIGSLSDWTTAVLHCSSFMLLHARLTFPIVKTVESTHLPKSSDLTRTGMFSSFFGGDRNNYIYNDHNIKPSQWIWHNKVTWISTYFLLNEIGNIVSTMEGIYIDRSPMRLAGIILQKYKIQKLKLVN